MRTNTCILFVGVRMRTKTCILFVRAPVSLPRMPLSVLRVSEHRHFEPMH